MMATLYRLWTLGIAGLIAVSVGACGNTGVPQSPPSAEAATTTPKPPPKDLTQLCEELAWPRPVPAAVGVIFDDLGERFQPLECLTGVRGLGPDGSVVWEKGFYKPQTSGFDRIADISPPPGTPIGRHDPVTVNLVPVDLDEPPAYHPCDWVTETEATALLGTPATARHLGRELENLRGSTNWGCHYDSVDRSYSVETELRLTGARVIYAGSEFGFWAGQPDSTRVSGVGVDATCASIPKQREKHALYVLLPDERIYIVTGRGGESCDTLKQFAQAAIPRIGA